MSHDQHLSPNHQVASAVFSTDGKAIASGLGEKTVELWDATSGERLQRLEIPVQKGIGMAPDLPPHVVAVDLGVNPTIGPFSSNGRLLAVEAGHEFLLFDVATRKPLISVDLNSVVGPTGQPQGRGVFALTDTVLATAFYSGTIALWDLKTGEKIRQFVGYRNVASLSISPDGRTLASCVCEVVEPVGHGWPGDDDFGGHAIQLWDMPTGRLLLTIERHLSDKRFESQMVNVQSVVFSPDGRSLVSGSEDKTIRMWEAATGKQLLQWNMEDKVYRIAISPNGKKIAAILAQGALTCFPIDPGQPDKPRLAVDDKAFDRLWTDLAGQDAAQAYLAVQTLSRDGDDVPARIGKHLKPINSFAYWIAELDNDTFDGREAASKQLAAFGAQAEPALRKALNETESAEVRSRIQPLLKTIGEWVVTDPDTLRSLRAIWVLERMGTPEARAVLEGLANGAPEARQTQEAKAALDFLDKRAATAKP